MAVLKILILTDINVSVLKFLFLKSSVKLQVNFKFILCFFYVVVARNSLHAFLQKFAKGFILGSFFLMQKRIQNITIKKAYGNVNTFFSNKCN